MDYNQLMVKAINFNYPKEIPTRVGILPAVWKKYPEEMRRITAKYPQFFGDLSTTYDYEKNIPETYHVGKFYDEWGCLWENVEEGMEAIVTGHPLKTREDIVNLEIPTVEDGRLPHGFMYLRLLDLRGFEEAMIDFAEEPVELQILIDKVLEYNLHQLDIRLKTVSSGEIVYFGDDLGMQKGIAIGAEKWRKYLKPCYKKLYAKVHEVGAYVYMHTDGDITEIMPDLHEVGADMINPQFRANGIENLVRVCKGKIPINLDLDRQLFPFATAKEIDEHIFECVKAMYLPQGGLGLSLVLGMDMTPDICEAAIESCNHYRFYKG